MVNSPKYASCGLEKHKTYAVGFLYCLFYLANSGCNDDLNKNRLSNNSVNIIKTRFQSQENKISVEEPVNIYFKKDGKIYDNIQEYVDTLISDDMLDKKGDNIIVKKIKQENLQKVTDFKSVYKEIDIFFEFIWHENYVNEVNMNSDTSKGKTYRVLMKIDLSNTEYERTFSELSYSVLDKKTMFPGILYEQKRLDIFVFFNGNNLNIEFRNLKYEDVQKFKEGDKVRVTYKTVDNKITRDIVIGNISYEILPRP